MKTFTSEGQTRVFRILLVDDNRNGLLARKSVLEEHGYLVHAYSSPTEALAEFGQEAYDLLITDFRMPTMTGTQLIAKIRGIHPSLPVVLISGVVDVLGLDEKSTGADFVIAKNSTEITHLVRAVKRLLEPQAPKKPVRSQAARSASAVRQR